MIEVSSREQVEDNLVLQNRAGWWPQVLCWDAAPYTLESERTVAVVGRRNELVFLDVPGEEGRDHTFKTTSGVYFILRAVRSYCLGLSMAGAYEGPAI